MASILEFLPGEDESILPVTEQQPIKTDKEELEEAEEATENVEEESKAEETESAEDQDLLSENDSEEMSADAFTDEELDVASPRFLLYLRFLPRFTYGDGTNSDTPASCPSCADAADAAIIDAEIGPDEESEEPGSKEFDEKKEEAVEGGGDTGDDFGDMGGNDFGGDMGDDLGGGEETPEENQGGEPNQDETQLPELRAELLRLKAAQEAFTDDVAEGIGAGVDLFKKLIKVGKSAWANIRDHSMRSVGNMTKIQKFWEKKLSKIIDKIDEEYLARQKAISFPQDVWTDCAKAMADIISTLLRGTQLVADDSSEVITSDLNNIMRAFESVGINIDLKSNRANLTEFNSKHARDSIIDLGFTPRNIFGCVEYLGHLGQVLDPKMIKKMKSDNEALLTKLKEAVAKNDEKAKVQLLRLDFLMLAENTAYQALDTLVSDLLHILSNYEDAANQIRKRPGMSPEEKEQKLTNQILEKYMGSSVKSNAWKGW